MHAARRGQSSSMALPNLQPKGVPRWLERREHGRSGFVVICRFECGIRGMKDWLSIFAWLAAGFSLLFLSIIVVPAAD